MIKVKRIDHVAIAVGDPDAAGMRLQGLFGLAEGAREHVADQQTDVLFLDCVPGGTPAAGAGAPTSIELIAPAASPGQSEDAGNPGLRRFLDKRGPGLHHICFEVEDLEGALASLKAAGVRLIDEVPRVGARGHRVAFLHPAATGGVLFELCAAGHSS
jgi:methylmalonyl-CoA/ethylmalonyl-CoA epimerase